MVSDGGILLLRESSGGPPTTTPNLRLTARCAEPGRVYPSSGYFLLYILAIAITLENVVRYGLPVAFYAFGRRWKMVAGAQVSPPLPTGVLSFCAY